MMMPSLTCMAVELASTSVVVFVRPSERYASLALESKTNTQHECSLDEDKTKGYLFV